MLVIYIDRKIDNRIEEQLADSLIFVIFFVALNFVVVIYAFI